MNEICASEEKGPLHNLKFAFSTRQPPNLISQLNIRAGKHKHTSPIKCGHKKCRFCKFIVPEKEVIVKGEKIIQAIFNKNPDRKIYIITVGATSYSLTEAFRNDFRKSESINFEQFVLDESNGIS